MFWAWWAKPRVALLGTLYEEKEASVDHHGVPELFLTIPIYLTLLSEKLPLHR